MTSATRFDAGPPAPAMSPLRVLTALALTLALAGGGLGSARAGLLAEGQVLRSIPFAVRDGHKPMIAARVGAESGFMMLANGTPDALFLNRDAAALPEGSFVARGVAASGQAIDVQSHSTPAVWIDGVPVVIANTVRSGNFQFTASGPGSDFLGFIGTGMLEGGAFVLDYVRLRGSAWRLAGLTIGGIEFAPVTVRVVDANGPQDFRQAGRA